MIKLFGQTDTSFATNGDKVLSVGKAKVHKEDNGDYHLEIECDLSYSDWITVGRIIAANTPTGDQAFRISSVEKTRLKIKATAKHLFYDSLNYLIADSYVVDKNCNDALDHLNMATDVQSPFKTVSDITTIDSYRCVRKTLYEAVTEVLARWGNGEAHLVRDNWQIGIRSKIGQDNGVTIRYAKNLQEITCSEDWSNVVTKLMPVGKDGLLLDEKYVYADTQYDIPYTKTVSFDQNEVLEDDYKDADGTLDEEKYTHALKEDLLSQAQAYLAVNQYPQVNYTLKANIENVTDVGDTIEVIDERLGINLTTQVIAFDYDCILEKYTSVEFGNTRKKLQDLVSNVKQTLDKTVSEASNTMRVTLQNELKEATDKIWGALGNSYVIYEGDKILVVDQLPKESAKNVLMINSGGIGFSNTGINGTFSSAWTIDNTLDMENINVINLTADLIKGGTLKLGSAMNQSGILEIYDESNALLGVIDKNGFKMYGQDGGYVVINEVEGFAGYDATGTKIYWVDRDEFHMRKSVVEEEITLCNRMRFLPVSATESYTNADGKLVTMVYNDGIGLVSTVETDDDKKKIVSEGQSLSQ